MRKQKIVTAVSVVPKYELKLNLLRLFDKIILRKLSKVTNNKIEYGQVLR